MDEVKADELEWLDFVESVDKQQSDISEYPVMSEEEASKALWNIKRIDAEIDRIENVAAADIKRIIEWTKDKKEKLNNSKSFYLLPLESYMRAVYENDNKVKHRDYPGGRVGIRKAPDRVEIKDGFEAEKLYYREDVSHLIQEKHVYSFDKKKIAQVIKETGEIPEFAEVIEGEKRFYYE